MEYDISELSKEKTLLDIRLAARRLPPSSFNQWSLSITFVLSFIYVAFTRSSTSIMAQRTRDLADTGFNFTITILGFLIAGFTVFATITKEELFQTMAVKINNKTGLSTLKYNLFAYMRVFIDYLIFCAYCLSIKIIGSQSGPLSEVLDILPFGNISKLLLARIFYALTIILIFYVLLQLKSFVYNVYHFVITTVQWSFITKPFSIEKHFGLQDDKTS